MIYEEKIEEQITILEKRNKQILHNINQLEIQCKEMQLHINEMKNILRTKYTKK